MRNIHTEWMSSASPPNSDIARRGWHFAFVPTTDSRSAASSFDHLVSASQESRRDRQSERLGSLQIDDQFYLGALLDWEVSRLDAVQNLSDVNTCLLIKIDEAASVTHQAAELSEYP